MYQILIDQAKELYVLGMELFEQQEMVALVYNMGYDIKLPEFIQAYKKLSEMSTRYMQLEIAHQEFSKNLVQTQAWKQRQSQYRNRGMRAG